jgi:6-phosphogluconolactonase
VQELTGGLTVFSYSKGKLKSRSNNYFSERFKGTFTGADIHISPDGKFTSNRGEANTISTFRILKRKIRIKGQTSSLGKDHGILQLIQLEISFWWHINIRMTL